MREDAVGLLHLADVADDLLNVIRRDARHRRHVAERPVMLPHSLTDRCANTEVGVMAGLVDAVDQRWALTGALGIHPVTERAVGVEQCLPCLSRVGQGRSRRRDLLSGVRIRSLVVWRISFATSDDRKKEEGRDQFGGDEDTSRAFECGHRGLAHHGFQILAGTSIGDERAQEINFTHPYIPCSVVVHLGLAPGGGCEGRKWRSGCPSIHHPMGTLFERGLDPRKRAQLGAHYTDRDKIMLIVEPVIVRPWLAEWKAAKVEIAACLERSSTAPSKRRAGAALGQAQRRLREFLERLRGFTVLDPACGSGNFLYLALHALKDLEHQVQLEAATMGLPRTFPEIGPASVKGIEINPYAAELARVSVWIGEIQWMRRNGFSESRKPILKPLDTIECRDAVLTEDGREPDWPQADVVIGNPPFLGNRRMRRELGHSTAETLPRVYAEWVRGKPDLVCYWFAKAGRLAADGDIQRAGLVATNSIRGGTNRKVLDKILEESAIFDAWSDEPWVVEAAAVRVSLICFSDKDAGLPGFLNGSEESTINSDLTGGNLDLTRSAQLSRNKGVAFQGDIKRGAFDIPGDLARQWLRLPANPNGRPNSEVLKPWVNGMDLTRRPAGKWIIDFGWTMLENDAALYEAPFTHVLEHVKPVRQRNREKTSREFWFRHWNPRPAMRQALDGLSHYIATPTVAKHRLFAWYDARICPDHQLIVIARDDDTTFGILHSRFHEAWSLRLGTSLEDRPRYTPTTTFQTFPFPEGLTPDVPARDYADDPCAAAIADAARRLVEPRDRWLNPPEWVEWVDEPVPGYPKRPVPRDEAAAREIKKRTLTNLYNQRPQWLANAHANLDSAVAAAYGWPADISEKDALGELLEMNLARSG